MSKYNQKYVKTLAKVCRKKKYVTALKSMSTTSKSMSQHTEYVKSSPIFLMCDCPVVGLGGRGYRLAAVHMVGEGRKRKGEDKKAKEKKYPTSDNLEEE